MKVSMVAVVFFALLLGITYADLLLSQDYMVMTPGGLRPRSCVHEVPSGASVARTENGDYHVTHPNGDSQVIPKCLNNLSDNSRRGQSGGGWQVFAFYNATNQATVFDGTWNVPGTPIDASQGQLLYLFTGLVNTWAPTADADSAESLGFNLAAGAEDIIQPVLQWGVGPAGGGAYWSMASWYVSDVALHSNLITTASGHTIYGTMHKSNPNSWKIVTLDKTSGDSTELNVHRDNTYYEPWAFVTLEVYNVQTCSAYPKDPVAFKNLLVKVDNGVTLTPRWLVSSYEQICDEQVIIQSPTAVTIDW